MIFRFDKRSGFSVLGLVFSVFLFLFSIYSCDKKEDIPDHYVNTPIAGFTWTGNDGPAPVTIQFVNTSENADLFEWDFGDGGTSVERDPQHTYHNTTNLSKAFSITLKATDSSSGLFQRKSKVIEIQPGS